MQGYVLVLAGWLIVMRYGRLKDRASESYSRKDGALVAGGGFSLVAYACFTAIKRVQTTCVEKRLHTIGSCGLLTTKVANVYNVATTSAQTH